MPFDWCNSATVTRKIQQHNWLPPLSTVQLTFENLEEYLAGHARENQIGKTGSMHAKIPKQMDRN
jgi:hypothetical protein